MVVRNWVKMHAPEYLSGLPRGHPLAPKNKNRQA